MERRIPNRKIAADEVVKRCENLVAEWQEADARVASAREKIRAAEAEKSRVVGLIEDCKAAARVLGFELPTPLLKLAERAKLESVSRSELSYRPSIKDEILQLAEAAYPNAVRAVGLRKLLEEKRGPLHEKTVGMTLYRLSKEGLMQRNGWDWFWIRPENRLTPAEEKEAAVL